MELKSNDVYERIPKNNGVYERIHKANNVCEKAPKGYDVDNCKYQKKNCIMQCAKGWYE